MKKILVPTDFSPTADNALKYAIQIATEFKSELYLYHVYAFDRFNYDLNFREDEQPYTKQMERNMEKTKLKFIEEIKQKGLTLKTMVERDDVFSLFRNKTEEHGIDLIIMGSKGASGFEKIVFGSVAATAIEMSRIPVWVITPTCTFSSLDRIVLSIDNKEVKPNVLSPLQKLAAGFNAKVTLLNVTSGEKTNKNTHQKIDLYMEGVETTIREIPKSRTINESINEYIKNEGVDLLCMIRREKGFFESIFSKSITKAQVFDSHIPLLVLPENGSAF
jgi:nucleotide-binding universal stress UspA family protein